MNLMRKPPPGQKPPPKRSDPDHLARVARLTCCICDAFGMHQTSNTQVHHVFHGRYATDRAPDHMTIPLCEGHHLGMFDTSKLAIHRDKAAWAEAYGPDHEWVAPTLDRLGV